MTDDELKAIEARQHTAHFSSERVQCIDVDLPALVAEVRRLREVERRHDALYAHFADAHQALGQYDDGGSTIANQIRRILADNERLRSAKDGVMCDPTCPSCAMWRLR